MSNYSTQLYNTLTNVDMMRALLSSFITDSRDQAIALLQKSGVAISNSAPAKQIQLAYLKAIKDSASFRDQVATALTGSVARLKQTLPGKSNFIGNSNIQYYNDVTDVFGGTIDPNSSTVSVSVDQANAAVNADNTDTTDNTTPVTPFAPLTPIGVAATGPAVGSISGNPNAVASTVTGPGSSSGGGNIFSSIASIFTPKVIQQGIATGLQAYSTNLTAKANQTSEKSALAIEQAKLAQAQLAAQNPAGLSTGWIIGLSIMGVVVIITLIAVLSRKKK